MERDNIVWTDIRQIILETRFRSLAVDCHPPGSFTGGRILAGVHDIQYTRHGVFLSLDPSPKLQKREVAKFNENG